MTKPEAIIACLGDLMLEQLIRVVRLPTKNETVIHEQSVSMQLGGPAFNVAWYLRQLGRSVALIGAYGSEDSAQVLHQVRAARLSTTSLTPYRGRTDTLLATVSGKHHQSWYMRSALPARIRVRFLAKSRGAETLILTGSRHSVIRHVYDRLAKPTRGRTVVFNPSYAIAEFPQTELRSMCIRANLTIVNEWEADHLIRVFRVSRIKDIGARIRGSLIVTRGRSGQLIVAGKRQWTLKGSPADPRNPIGAGDAFLAGLVHKMANGQDLVEAAKFGSALASLVVASEDVRIRVSEQRVRRAMRTTNRVAI